jgi:tripartite-type tricarboxylate transporter receptor subunit TctC
MGRRRNLGCMKASRRTFLQLAAGAAALPFASTIAWAQAYPARAVRVIVGFTPGSAPDIVARLVGQSLSERLGQQFLVDNRPGAGGNIGTEVAVRAPADGYTLLLVGAPNAINASLYDKLSFDFLRDIAPVACIERTSLVVVVHPSLPVGTVPEFIAFARANPGKISMASAGVGSTTHVAGELFKMMTSVDMTHVPYRGGGQVMTDLIAGQVQVSFMGLLVAIEHIRRGKLRALAVTTAARSDVLPGIPTVGEFVTGYEASAFWGVGAPRGTPAEIIDKLNREINAGLSDPRIRSRLTDGGGTVLAGSPADFGKLLGNETEKWAKVIKLAGIRPE